FSRSAVRSHPSVFPCRSACSACCPGPPVLPFVQGLPLGGRVPRCRRASLILRRASAVWCVPQCAAATASPLCDGWRLPWLAFRPGPPVVDDLSDQWASARKNSTGDRALDTGKKTPTPQFSVRGGEFYDRPAAYCDRRSTYSDRADRIITGSATK